MKLRQLTVIVGLALALGIASRAAGATVGLWTFDSLEDATPPSGDPPTDPPGGETLLDSSGNNLHMVSGQDFGTVTLTSDRPAVMPSGTFALDSHAGGARLFSTPSTDLLNVGKTGQLTVETWFKDVGGGAGGDGTNSSFPYVLSFGTTDASPGSWAYYINAAADNINFFAYPNAGFPERALGMNPMDGNWHHIAATVQENGPMRVYLDGVQVGTDIAVGAFPDFSSVMKLGRNQVDTQTSSHFLIDELRISDVALLPGAGTGIGELAHNASLVPEPGSLGVLMMASLSLLRRRRRGH